MEHDVPDLKLRTARSLKWNVVDRISSQVLYAVTGIILANILSKTDFGMVGAILVFQAFASLLVDSGFSYALLQRKHPTELDYSSVLWFNMGMAVGLYVLLWICAPLIADCFGGDQRLIPLSRVMFITFILNASAIVQTNKLMKKMEVKMVAVSNVIGLSVGAITGIWLAVTGYGAWAIVWQSIALSGTKSAILWLTSKWHPLPVFSMKCIRSFFSVGSGMMATSFLNTVFNNIYSFFIGNKVGLVSLAYYTQSDKWSKMGISSISQILTSSFLPALSLVQDDSERFRNAVSKMNRFTSYILFPCTGILCALATPIFHLLFHDKWDASIVLFQLLLVRGVFVVYMSLYSNYIISLGHSKIIMRLEIIRDALALLALFLTFPYMTLETPEDVVLGIKIMLVGQCLASFISWIITLGVTCSVTSIPPANFLKDTAPYFGITLIALIFIMASPLELPPAGEIAANLGLATLIYLGVNKVFNSKIQKDIIGYVMYRFQKKAS